MSIHKPAKPGKAHQKRPRGPAFDCYIARFQSGLFGVVMAREGGIVV